jgi:S-adenosylmethionine hydrolase
MARAIITLTTDFGEGSPYAAQMKGVILSLNPDVTIVDISHKIPPQNVHQGALVLDQVTRRFPPQAVHIAVIDPGVGTARSILCCRIGEQTYIAPNNGLLTLVARHAGRWEAFVLSNRDFWMADVSATFHGRDIMAPVAAHLSLGVQPDQLGPPTKDLVQLDWPDVRVIGRTIEGAVMSADSFGNLITNIPFSVLSEAAGCDTLHLRCGNQQVRDFVQTYHQRSPGSIVALSGSSGLLEVAVVDGNAAESLGIGIGEPVRVNW